MAAVRVPPSACSTSQSMITDARRGRPCRPPRAGCGRSTLDFRVRLPLFAAGGLTGAAGVGGARQHAVFGGQPAGALCRAKAGHELFDAGQAHGVSPNSISTEPSACLVKPRVMQDGTELMGLTLTGTHGVNPVK